MIMRVWSEEICWQHSLFPVDWIGRAERSSTKVSGACLCSAVSGSSGYVLDTALLLYCMSNLPRADGEIDDKYCGFLVVFSVAFHRETLLELLPACTT
jgi:hypothetical protein